ncbi:MAG: metallophosphoesterase [Candidatus Eisenbacteria bacterium]
MIDSRLTGRIRTSMCRGISAPAALLTGLGTARTLAGTLAAALAGLVILFAGRSDAATLVPEGGIWKYDDSGVDLGTSWSLPGYDDSAWSDGPGPLGYGDSFIVTTLSYGPDPFDKYPTEYFRKSFDLPTDPGLVSALFIRARYDDGVIVYLNGVEVLRRAMPSGIVDWGTYASESHEGAEYEFYDLTAWAPLLVAGTNHLAAEVHQRSGDSSDLVWDAEVTYLDETPAVLRGPYLQSGSETGVVVRWRTNVPTASQVDYGSAPELLTQSVSDGSATTEHEILLSGLMPGTTYYYAVGTGDSVLVGGNTEHLFSTSPPQGTTDAFRAWIVGDSGEANQSARDVRDAYLGFAGADPADLFLMLGDNAYDAGTDDQYQAAVFDTYAGILQRTVVWPTRGNHDDLHAGDNNDYYEIFTLPTAGEAGGLPSGTEAYYSFDYANTHFICLDSDASDRSPNGAMLTWLAQDLAATDQPWKVAFWHHPPYTKGSHDSDDDGDSSGRMTDMRENALPILEAGGIDLVLCGHSHAYERSYFLDGHYGYSNELTPEMIVDAGDGSESGDGAYEKPPSTPHAGTVYTVAGSSSKTGGGTLDHPVMLTSLNELGSVILDIEDLRLHLTFLDDQGVVRDEFTMLHFGPAGVEPDADPNATGDAAPNGQSGDPSREDGAIDALVPGTVWSSSPAADRCVLGFEVARSARVRVTVHDLAGRSIRTLVDREMPNGPHELTWDLETDQGRTVPNGVFFARVSVADGSEVCRIIVQRTPR